MTFAMILDIIVVVLLVPTIIFAVILNNRLSILRRNREELARLIAAFNEATVRAESGIPRLKKTSEESTKTLQEKVERAQVLRDDLAFMIERAEGMAARLEGTVRDARTEGARAPRGMAPASPHGLDIESAAEAAERAERLGGALGGALNNGDRLGADRAAERAAERIAERFAPERERPSLSTERERGGSDRIGIDRSALERMAEERGGLPPASSNEERAPARRPAAAARPLERPRTGGEDASPERALAERILADHAESDFSAPPSEPRRAALPAPSRPAPRSSERAAPAPDAETPPLRERPLTRSAAGSRPADRLASAPSARVTRPGQVLGAALADDGQGTLAGGAPPRSSAVGASASRATKDDDDRSEAERELLRALRSAR